MESGGTGVSQKARDVSDVLPSQILTGHKMCVASQLEEMFLTGIINISSASLYCIQHFVGNYVTIPYCYS